MCVPSGILNFASAEEGSQITTVTLGDTENGFMQFSESYMNASTASQDGYHMMQVNEEGEFEQIGNDGSVWAFTPRDSVEVELFPNANFHVQSFNISDSESGDVLAQEETQDNLFSFTMPQASVLVETGFSDTEFEEGSGVDAESPENPQDEGPDVQPGDRSPASLGFYDTLG